MVVLDSVSIHPGGRKNKFHQFGLSIYVNRGLASEIKGNISQISMKFYIKNRKIYFETLFSPSFIVLHSSLMVYMNHMKLIFQNLLLYCTKKVPKITIIFCSTEEFSYILEGFLVCFWDIMW